jgi:hypothetical protein
MASSRYVKVILLDAVKTNLMGCQIVGQSGDEIIVERPAPKPRAKAATPRKPRTAKKPIDAVTLTAEPPIPGVARG